MDCDALRDDQWERLKGFVPGGTKGKRGPRTNNRRFLDALLWMARSGSRWRDSPERFGNYHSVKRRYYRWIEMRVLDTVLAALVSEADLEWLMIDSTIVRAHQNAAGACKAKGGRCPGPGPVSGRSEHKNPCCGRRSWKSGPFDWHAGATQRNGIAFAHDLIDGLTADVMIADKGYDADHLIDKVSQTGAETVHPAETKPQAPALL
jgi:transposase